MSSSPSNKEVAATNDEDNLISVSSLEALPIEPSKSLDPTSDEACGFDGSVQDSCSLVKVSDPNDILHKVKRIKWKNNEVPIITQNNNGPCPLIAILNALLLKGCITIPPERQELSGGELVSIVGNAVFDVPRGPVTSEMHLCLEQNTEDAVTLIHKLLTGLDVNVKFSGVRDFEFTRELSIFDVLGVPLYHGWVVDPSSEFAPVVMDLSYNQLANNIVCWQNQDPKNTNDTLVAKALLCEEFIKNSVSQLTIHGLFDLGFTLKNEEIAVLFRNNHFSTLYKRDEQLYQLLTDQGFLHEKAVWETLSDIDSTFSVFVTSSFQRLESCSSEDTSTNMTKEQQISSDHELAAMLQKEAESEQKREDEFKKVVTELGLQNLPDEEIAKRLQERENQIVEDARSTPIRKPDSSKIPPQVMRSEKKNKDNCVIL